METVRWWEHLGCDQKKSMKFLTQLNQKFLNKRNAKRLPRVMPPKISESNPWQIPTHTIHVSTFSAINNLSQQTERNLICKSS